VLRLAANFPRRRGFRAPPRVGRQRALAFNVGGKLFEPAVEFADAFLGARLFALKRFPRDDEAL